MNQRGAIWLKCITKNSIFTYKKVGRTFNGFMLLNGAFFHIFQISYLLNFMMAQFHARNRPEFLFCTFQNLILPNPGKS